MEVWRVLGAVAVGSGGLMLVLVAMAQARESTVRARRTRHEGAARVARTAATGLVALAAAVLLVLTVLPQFVVWALGATVWLIVLALFLVG